MSVRVHTGCTMVEVLMESGHRHVRVVDSVTFRVSQFPGAGNGCRSWGVGIRKGIRMGMVNVLPTLCRF